MELEVWAGEHSTSLHAGVQTYGGGGQIVRYKSMCSRTKKGLIRWGQNLGQGISWGGTQE